MTRSNGLACFMSAPLDSLFASPAPPFGTFCAHAPACTEVTKGSQVLCELSRRVYHRAVASLPWVSRGSGARLAPCYSRLPTPPCTRRIPGRGRPRRSSSTPCEESAQSAILWRVAARLERKNLGKATLSIP